MKEFQGLSATWSAHSDLPHRSSPSLSAKSRRDTYFRKNSPTRTGRTFLGSTSCWSYVTLSSAMSVVASCASVSERIHSSSSNCFVVGSFFFLLEHQLHVEQKATFFRKVSRGPIGRESVKTSERAHPLASSCEGDDGIQMFLPFASRITGTHWRQFDVGQRSDTCFASTLSPLRAPPHFVSPSSPGDSGRFGTLLTGRMSSYARTP